MAVTDLQPDPQHHPKSRLAGLLPYTTVALIIAALYVAWVFYSRHTSALRAQRAIESKKEENRKRVVDQIYGGGEVRFSVFSADAGVLKPGASTQLCYGVLNATTVRIEPPVGEDLKPTYRHCVEIAPKKTTTYTITASNDKGESKSESLIIQVR